MARKRLNAITSIPKSVDATTKRWMQTVAEALEVRLGRRGDPGEAAVTFNDLIDGGIAKLGRRGINPITGAPDIQPPDNGSEDGLLPPPKPKNLYVVASFKTILLHWDSPPNRGDVTYTEIARSEDANFDNATIIGGSGGRQYLDILTMPEGKTYYYWARHVTYRGVTGPWTDAKKGTKLADMGLVLESLNSALSSEPADMGAPDETLIFHANRFAVRVGEGASVQHPFIIIYGKINGDGLIEETEASDPDGQAYVVIDSAFIRSASIQSGQLGSVSSGLLELPDGTPITNVQGLLTATGIDTDNLEVASAATFSGSVASRYYSSGSSGWYISQSGYIEMNEGYIRDAVQIGGESVSALRSRVGDAVYTAGNALGEARDAQSSADNAYNRANSAYSTANSAKDTANTVYNRIYNNWTRPYTTLIDGNQIYTGDAFVDTLMIKGQAVTIPAVSVSGGQDNLPRDRWSNIGSVWINPFGGTVTVIANVSFYANASDSPINGDASASVSADIRINIHDDRGLIASDIVYSNSVSDFDYGAGNNEGGDADVYLSEFTSVSTIVGSTRGNVVVYVDFKASGGPDFNCGVRNIKIAAIGGKR